MNPKQTLSELHRIASKLSNSKSPDKNLVINELNKLVHRIAAGIEGDTISKKHEISRFYSESRGYNELMALEREWPEVIKASVEWMDSIINREYSSESENDSWDRDNFRYNAATYHCHDFWKLVATYALTGVVDPKLVWQAWHCDW